jgi:hypothetical protein
MSPAPASRPCRAFLDDFSAFVDGHLSPGRRAELQAHVDCCQGCLDHLTAYRRGITVLRSIDAEAPADFWERLERRLWTGHELTVVQGGEAGGAKRAGRWPGAAVTVAAAAVLALFLIARGVGPESRPGTVGPRSVRASVAVTLPEVPDAEPAAAVEGSTAETETDVAPAYRGRGAVAMATAEPQPTAPSDPDARAGLSSERAIERLHERVFQDGLGRAADRSSLASDGWVEPVRLGHAWSRSSRGQVSLIRASAAVTPSPWNVDRAVSLP